MSVFQSVPPLVPTRLSIVAAPTPPIERGEVVVVVSMGGAHSQLDSCVHACAAAIGIPTQDMLPVLSVVVVRDVRGMIWYVV